MSCVAVAQAVRRDFFTPQSMATCCRVFCTPPRSSGVFQSKSAVVLEFMLVCPHDMLQNHPIRIDRVSVQLKSCQPSQRCGRLLRLAASSNKSFDTGAQVRPCPLRTRFVCAGQVRR